MGWFIWDLWQDHLKRKAAKKPRIKVNQFVGIMGPVTYHPSNVNRHQVMLYYGILRQWAAKEKLLSITKEIGV